RRGSEARGARARGAGERQGRIRKAARAVPHAPRPRAAGNAAHPGRVGGRLAGARARRRRRAEEHARGLREGARELRPEEITEGEAMNRKSMALAAAAPLCSVSALPARATGGLYLGAGIGESTVKEDNSSGNFDENSAGYKAFIGYRFDKLPL